MPVEEKNGWVHIRPDVLPALITPADEEEYEGIVSAVPEKPQESVDEETPS